MPSYCLSLLAEYVCVFRSSECYLCYDSLFVSTKSPITPAPRKGME